VTVRPPGSPRVIHIRFTPRKTRENPHKIRLLGEAAFSREALCTGVLGHPWSILRSRRVCAGWGGARVRDLEDPVQSGRRCHPPEEAKILLEEGRFCSNFLGWWDLVFAGGFGKNGWLDVVFWW